MERNLTDNAAKNYPQREADLYNDMRKLGVPDSVTIAVVNYIKKTFPSQSSNSDDA